MDKLHAMSIFVEIAERGSLTAAADVLDKSLPTVVRVLAALEESLGVRLFNRTTRRLAITDEGRVYLEHCRRILAAVEESEHVMRQTHSEVGGVITLTAPVKFGEMYVAPIIASFLARYPKVEVKLLLLDRVVDLLEEGIDVAVRIAPLPDSTLVARHVAYVRQVIAASPKLIARVGAPAVPQDLVHLPCIRSPGIGETGTWTFSEGGKLRNVKVSGQLICNSIGASVAACIAEGGFGRFLCYQVMPAAGRGELDIVLRDFEPEPRPLSLLYPQNRLGSARHSKFIDWMVTGLKSAMLSASAQ